MTEPETYDLLTRILREVSERTDIDRRAGADREGRGPAGIRSSRRGDHPAARDRNRRPLPAQRPSTACRTWAYLARVVPAREPRGEVALRPEQRRAALGSMARARRVRAPRRSGSSRRLGADCRRSRGTVGWFDGSAARGAARRRQHVAHIEVHRVAGRRVLPREDGVDGGDLARSAQRAPPVREHAEQQESGARQARMQRVHHRADPVRGFRSCSRCARGR